MAGRESGRSFSAWRGPAWSRAQAPWSRKDLPANWSVNITTMIATYYRICTNFPMYIERKTAGYCKWCTNPQYCCAKKSNILHITFAGNFIMILYSLRLGTIPAIQRTCSQMKQGCILAFGSVLVVFEYATTKPLVFLFRHFSGCGYILITAQGAFWPNIDLS